MSIPVFTKDSLIHRLKEIAQAGWVKNGRHGNHGGIGNTLEDLLGVPENNLQTADAGEWELKAQRLNTTSLTTLFHTEPLPRDIRFVPQVLLPKYGWSHQSAGLNYPEAEMSFRQTINGLTSTDRGFIVQIDRETQQVKISFDNSQVAIRHEDWLENVKQRAGLGELSPQPYWTFEDLATKTRNKLHNTFYAQAAVKRVDGDEYYHYQRIMLLEGFNFDGFLNAIETGQVLVDFDARSGHNHGTKFRLRQNGLPLLFEKATTIVP